MARAARYRLLFVGAVDSSKIVESSFLADDLKPK